MKPRFHPQPLNGPFDDAGVYVDFAFERRALLFDMGETGALSNRRALRLSHAFVSHTHMDHFAGFDRLLRTLVGRDKRLRLFGPPGFIAQVGHKLAAYTWNLVHNYEGNLILETTELAPDGAARRTEYHSRAAFQPAPTETVTPKQPFLAVDEAGFRVRYAALDHGIPSLAYALEEAQHVNIRKNRLAARGLDVGPWLNQLKAAVLAGAPADTHFQAPRLDGGESPVCLGELRADAFTVTPGQRLAYVTDCAYTPENVARITHLAEGVDHLFIEAVFLERDRATAADKRHLTAHQAGTIARRCGAVRATPFHFSVRYREEEEALRREFEQAWRSGG